MSYELLNQYASNIRSDVVGVGGLGEGEQGVVCVSM